MLPFREVIMTVRGVLWLGLVPFMLYAQPPDSLWSRTYGGSDNDRAAALQQTSDGGYIVAGTTRSFGAGNYDFWVVKTDSSGDRQWSRTYGGGSCDQCYSVEQTSDGGYILAGNTQSFGAGGVDYWLVKTDSLGNVLWDRTFGGSHWDECYSVRQTSDGGYLLAGSTWSYGVGASDCWLVKTNANGDSVWTHSYGWVHDDYCVGTVEVADSGYVLVWNGDYSEQGVWLAELDGDGQIVWIGNIVDSVWCKCFQLAGDGGYVLAGDSSTWGCEDYDFWLMRIDDAGNPIWSRTYGGMYPDECNSVMETWDGGCVLAGYTQLPGSGYRDFQVMRTDADGDILWSRAFGGNSSDECSSVLQTRDGGYILAGTTWSFGAGGSDAWLVSMESDCPDWTPRAPEVTIETVGGDVRLCWFRVTESVGGCPIEIQEYRVYSSGAVSGPFELIGVTVGEDTSRVVPGAIFQYGLRFYCVGAVNERGR
jgi:hypothetical protein